MKNLAIATLLAAVSITVAHADTPLTFGLVDTNQINAYCWSSLQTYRQLTNGYFAVNSLSGTGAVASVVRIPEDEPYLPFSYWYTVDVSQVAPSADHCLTVLIPFGSPGAGCGYQVMQTQQGTNLTVVGATLSPYGNVRLYFNENSLHSSGCMYPGPIGRASFFMETLFPPIPGTVTIIDDYTDPITLQTTETSYSAPAWVPEVPLQIHFFTNMVPPANGMYVLWPPNHISFSNGAVISNLTVRAMGQGLAVPATGASSTHELASELDFDLSVGGGPFTHMSAPGLVTLSTQAASTSGGQQTYSLQMLRLAASGGTLPSGMQLRVGTNSSSMGAAAVNATPGGFMISSFFDVFLDLSLDGGQTWSPSAQAAELDLRADPTLIPPAPEATAHFPPEMENFAMAPGQLLTWSNGVVVRNWKLSLFSGSADLGTVQGGMAGTALSPGSTAGLDVSLDGGQTFTTVSIPAQVALGIHQVTTGSNTLFDLVVSNLNLTVPGLSSTTVQLRASAVYPSYGEISMQTQTDATFTASSFFDVFLDSSSDGGQTWMAGNSPAHFEMQTGAPRIPTSSPFIFPTNMMFAIPCPMTFPGGRIINNLLLYNLSPSLSFPLPGQSASRSFTGTADVILSLDGGQTYNTNSASISGLLNISNNAPAGPIQAAQYFTTELAQLNVSGGGLPTGVALRQSPTLRSFGRTSVSQAPGGGYRYTSFFNGSFELTADNGATWLAGPKGVNVPGTLCPSCPTTPSPFAPYVIRCPSDMVVNGGPTGAYVNYDMSFLPTPYPDCPFGPFTGTCIPPSGSWFPTGTTTVTCVGSDGCGEHPTCSFTVTVLPSLIFKGLTENPLGQAVLSNTNSSLVLSNLSTGADGIRVGVVGADSMLINFNPDTYYNSTCEIAQVYGPYLMAYEPFPLNTNILCTSTFLGVPTPKFQANFPAPSGSNLTLTVSDQYNHLLFSGPVANGAWVDLNTYFPSSCTNAGMTVCSVSESASGVCWEFCKYGCAPCDSGTNCWISIVACINNTVTIADAGTGGISGLNLFVQGRTKPSSVTIDSEEIGMLGLLHSALGSAALQAGSGVLSVNNLGFSGEDGLAVYLPNLPSVDLKLAPTWLQSPGAAWRMTAVGQFNRAPNVELGSVSFGSTGQVFAVTGDFSAIGSTMTRVEVFQGSQSVGSTTISGAQLGTLNPGLDFFLVGSGAMALPVPCLWFWFGSSVEFVSPGGTHLTGDRFEFTAANPVGQAQALSKVCLQAANVGQFALLGASAPPAIGGILKRSDGAFEVDGTGLAGTSYRLEAVSSLMPPIIWKSIASGVADVYGSFQLLDTRPAVVQQFYRITTP